MTDPKDLRIAELEGLLSKAEARLEADIVENAWELVEAISAEIRAARLKKENENDCKSIDRS